MKTWPWKTIGIVALVLTAIAVFYFVKPLRATSDTLGQPVNPAFGEHIAGYTAGMVSTSSSIRIVLAQNAVDSLAVGQEAATKLFEFSPSIPGKAYWIDLRTIEFRPDERLASGQLYQVDFLLSRLIDNVPADLTSFHFNFQVIKQNYEVEIQNIKPVVNTDLTKQRIEGVLTTADFAEPAQVEEMVAAIQQGKKLPITWGHSGEGRVHQFSVADVVRGEQPSQVTLQLDGKQIGTDRVETKEVEIPALGDFKVTNIRVEQGSSQHIVVQFSDPLNEAQNLEGLMVLANAGSLDFEIKENEVRVYPAVRQKGTLSLTVEPGIRNINNYRMANGGSFEVQFEQLNPAVRFAGKGNIVPSGNGLVLPFEAVNLKRVEVQVIRIYESNVLQFFQVNDWDGNSELRRVGKPVAKQVISLENAGVTDLGKWNRFTLDLATLMKTEPGAIYQVRLGFRKEFSAFDCVGETDAGTLNRVESEEDWSTEGEESYWDSYEDYYYYGEDYDWEQRDNPCRASYYVSSSRKIRRNIIASDLGIIAKSGEDGSTTVFVTDIKTAKPLSGVQVDLFDYQLQNVGSVSTDGNGQCKIASRQTPFALVARQGDQRGYLKLQSGEALSVSNFDVGGEAVARGLKGFIYGERGVWRPGDSLYLTFMLEDKSKTLPAAHPVVMELYNPQGQVTNRLVRAGGENGFYTFATATAPDAPTGNWSAKVKVGGAEFSQIIKIETVKPNRLKINLKLAEDKITAARNNVRADLQVNWLHGAPGKNLQAQFEVTLTKGKTSFPKYPEYVFDDVTTDFSSETFSIFEGSTDETGGANFQMSIPTPESTAPGVLNAVVRGKVFEESGNFSVDRFTVPYYPYLSYTGIRLPKGDAARGMLLTDTTHRVDVVTVDADGSPVSRSGVRLSLYKIQWRWWWDQSETGNVNFMSGSYSQPIAQGTVNTSNGKGTWTFKVKYPEWGRFLVIAEDPVSGHRTTQTVYIDWPGWAGRARKEAEGATMLSFNSDKTAYNINEKATVVIPGSDNGRALISIENGSRIVQTDWLNTTKGDNTYTFTITRDMSPNVFIHVTLLQPHGQAINDLPIRMYGIVPIQVEDPATHLEPVLSMPDVLEPGEPVTITVSEKTKRKMTYTVAMVDEGLLDLTRFKTPEPWKRFYAREALGVRTWDVYDQVMGSFGGQLERLLAVGGDAELMSKEDDSKSNRFKPVVKFFGPFTLDGGTNKHTFTMPAYIGSVKTMVVAGYEGAYGHADKATPVRKPLMVLTTLPRVLGPGESVQLPVTLFAMDKNLKNAKVEVKVSGPVAIATSVQTVNLTSEQMTITFPMQVKEQLGWATVEVIATSGSFRAAEKTNIEVRNPNPAVTQVTNAIVEAGKSWVQAVDPIGMAGTNSAMLEVSTLPPINLGQRLRYLYQYPYGCVEQTTSAVFPQLFVDRVKTLTPEELSAVQRNVKAGVERLKSFQNRDGGFGYWPGDESFDSWSTSYVGHFLLEAEAKGYFVSAEMLKRWKKFQRSQAQSWRKSNESYSSELIQAYRLYTLALANDAELGAMNRLREQGNLPPAAGWMLATAYAKAGQVEAARKLVERLPLLVKPYQELAYSYGSDVRDQAIILEALVALQDRQRAFQIVEVLSEKLSNPNVWLSTQSTAWALKSVGLFAGANEKGDLLVKYSYNGKEATAATQLPMAQISLLVDGAKSREVKLENGGKGTLFVRLIREGIPARGDETEAANNLNIFVAYQDVDGNTIDPAALEQGQELVAAVRVSNPGLRGAYRNLALQQIFPSGWEINNLRLDGATDRLQADVPTYQDIRDDRVYTYFDLNPNQTKTFKVLLTASYAGSYYLPAVSCEAMYDRTIYARVKGTAVEVIKPKIQ
jgi:uncharacterized protein YfaS (alpha-2-macroglobulin family)